MTSKNIIHALIERYQNQATDIAMTYKDNGRWLNYRWQDVYQIVSSLAGGLQSLGLDSGEKVAIISETRPEWLLMDLSVLACGAVTVPIYPNLTPDDVQFILEDSEASVLVLEDLDQFKKWQALSEKSPHLKSKIKVCVIEALSIAEVHENAAEGFTPWSDLLEEGRKRLKEQKYLLPTLAEGIDTDDIATIPYTSGTTGRPKGVVLTHRQIMSELHDVFRVIPLKSGDTSLTFLPLAHIFGRVEALGSVYAGYALGFAESIDRIKDNLLEIRPTFLIAVPRIFEKLYATVRTQSESSTLRKRVFDLAVATATEMSETLQKNQAVPLPLALAYQTYERLVFSKVKDRLGGRLRFAVSGGAPLSAEIAKFFHGVGLPIFEGYGLTETTAGVCFNTPFRYRLGTVGPALDDVKIKIADDGEVLIKSDKVMREYYKNPQATAEVFQDGYFKTGDIGAVDSEGFLRITDRKKDLIKTAGGKYVAPQKLENLLKLHPLISNVLIHGDQKPYIVCLITLNTLEVQNRALATSAQIDIEVRKIVAEVNSGLASFESIKKFTVISKDFTVEGGELTPSLKVKRKVVEKQFAKEIEALYG
jgi:long-chain acyl-CoA synthetase